MQDCKNTQYYYKLMYLYVYVCHLFSSYNKKQHKSQNNNFPMLAQTQNKQCL